MERGGGGGLNKGPRNSSERDEKREATSLTLHSGGLKLSGEKSHVPGVQYGLGGPSKTYVGSKVVSCHRGRGPNWRSEASTCGQKTENFPRLN